MHNNSRATFMTAAEEDKFILQYPKNSCNVKEEPDSEHSEEPNDLVYEDGIEVVNLCEFKIEETADVEHSDEPNDLVHEIAVDFDNTNIKIEETDKKTECFNDPCSLKQIIRGNLIKLLQYSETLCNIKEEPDIEHFEKPDDLVYEDVLGSDNDNIKMEEINIKSECLNDEFIDDVCSRGILRADASLHGSVLGETLSVSDPIPRTVESNTASDLTGSTQTVRKKKAYVCDVCDRNCLSARLLVEHRRIHAGQRPYVCEVCNQGFARHAMFVAHKKLHNGKMHVYDSCNKEFTQHSLLVCHKRIHTAEKPYVCDVCNKGFSRHSILVCHKRIHTGEKPYVCDVCNKGFTRQENLVRHRRIHTGEKPYVCEVCNKRFTQKEHVLKHLRIHTG